jgi:hypothetical protein
MEVHFEEKKRVAFCGCRQTKNPPFCAWVSLADLTMWCWQRIRTASANDSVVLLEAGASPAEPLILVPCKQRVSLLGVDGRSQR